MLGVDGPHARRIVAFDAAPADVMEYYAGNTSVDALKLFDAYHRLRALIKHGGAR